MWNKNNCNDKLILLLKKYFKIFILAFLFISLTFILMFDLLITMLIDKENIDKYLLISVFIYVALFLVIFVILKFIEVEEEKWK